METNKATSQDMDPANITISWEDVFDELSVQSGSPAPKEVTDIFKSVCEVLERIDFRAAANLEPEQTVRREHIVVSVVNAAIDGLRNAGSGLAFLMGTFHCYVGTHWIKCGRAALRAFLTEASIAVGVESIPVQYHRFLNELEMQGASVTMTEQPAHSGQLHLVNFTNGTLEVSPGAEPRVREHRAAEMITHLIPHEYRREAQWEMWQRFLDRVIPDEASQLNLAEFFGSVFTGLKHEKALVLLGDGHNGKSVVFDVVRGVLGPDNVTHQSLESLNSEYHRAMLGGFLLNYSSEIVRNPKADIFKKMISCEPIEARLPYGKPFIMRQYARLAFNCNEMPKDVEHTEAFFRRLLIIPFNERIAEHERNPELAAQILEAESAGVLDWMLSGMSRLAEQGRFTPNPLADAALEQYRLESDSVALFVDEAGYVPAVSDSGAIRLADLHAKYRIYCSENIYRAVSSRTMAKRLRSRGFSTVHRNQGTYVLAERDRDESGMSNI